MVEKSMVACAGMGQWQKNNLASGVIESKLSPDAVVTLGIREIFSIYHVYSPCNILHQGQLQLLERQNITVLYNFLTNIPQPR